MNLGGAVVLPNLYAFKLARGVDLKVSPPGSPGLLDSVGNVPLMSCIEMSFLTKKKKRFQELEAQRLRGRGPNLGYQVPQIL